MVVKTYRGLLADGAQEKIPLGTKDGSVGYRVIRFDILSASPSSNIEHVVQIWAKEQVSVVATIDFTHTDWLGTAWESGGGFSRPENAHVIIDPRIINQDIFITHFEVVASAACNYYIELEQINLDHTQTMNATLKAIRGSAVD